MQNNTHLEIVQRISGDVLHKEKAFDQQKFSAANEQFYQSRARIYKSEAWYFTGLAIFFAQLMMVAILAD